MSRYDECLQFVLKAEGGYVNNQVDPGGATNKGITQRTYTTWLKTKGRPNADVRGISDVDVTAIYFEYYWTPVKGESYQRPMDLVMFDTAVNHGVSRAVKILQAALLIPQTGVYDAVTLPTALLDNPMQIAQETLTARTDFYTQLIASTPSQSVFANGWANRMEMLEKEAGL